MWVFGYGSLVWKVDFPYEQKIIGCVKGFVRRFYQYSMDHRGTPEKPGRVVTLVPSEKDCEVWGLAYKVREDNIQTVVAHLDYREKGGYTRTKALFYPKNMSKPFEITAYIGAMDNFNYAGEADLDSIAKQIVESKGPSGTNVEYVCMLARAMREIAPHIRDEHLYAIEEKVQNILKSNSQTKNDG